MIYQETGAGAMIKVEERVGVRLSVMSVRSTSTIRNDDLTTVEKMEK